MFYIFSYTQILVFSMNNLLKFSLPIKAIVKILSRNIFDGNNGLFDQDRIFRGGLLLSLSGTIIYYLLTLSIITLGQVNCSGSIRINLLIFSDNSSACC